ncbi:3-hydroxybutyrate dehydrogenase [Candidatus Nitronereus thalassa]|uniref:3-hydroxybutyrate dehydrogenase n=1 Tax=Candidatus Nitronereus thalassa TaxID=3020898 RepID=A0ABU3KDC0_9BACT|nr:3-hydroxybutyrate dehydrogenase [Candidatus Nitronereus thalassa]MDT7044258.1 3-hydroxybutyrate dehydrogenase [Candidatus Nitronereus thalassa]
MLKDRVALITGGGVGIGCGVAKALTVEGARVAICGRRPQPLEETVTALKEMGTQAIGIPADVTNRSDVERVVATIVAEWGKIDILVNNAGMSGRTPMDEMDDSRWLSILQTNLTGSYLCSKVVLPHMKAPGYGRIINLSSVLGRFGVPGYAAYCTAKHGIIGFTKAVALEVAERGITVNAVCPTWVDTAMARQGIEETAEVLGMPAEDFKNLAIEAVPIKRMADVEEIAATILFLCSPTAAAITGQAINVCGGATAASGG